MKHICNLCRYKQSELTMQQVSVQDGEYRIWTPARAAYFRSHHLKYPARTWLCSKCYGEAAQAKEWHSGEHATFLRRPVVTRRRNTSARKRRGRL
jgi:hypothetical protein